MNRNATNFPPFACASWVVMFLCVMIFGSLFCNAGNSIQISPTSVALAPNQIQQFSASLYDQFGNPLSPPNFTWSRVSGVGLVSEKGLYYGGTVPGSAMLQVTGGGATSSVLISVLPPAAGVPGLTARYYASTNLITPLMMRIDPFVNFDWGTNSPGPL
jgi:hypothetical protein